MTLECSHVLANRQLDVFDLWFGPTLCSVFYRGSGRLSSSSFETKSTKCSVETSARYWSVRIPLRIDMVDPGFCPSLCSVAFYCGPGKFSSSSFETKLTRCSIEPSARYGSSRMSLRIDMVDLGFCPPLCSVVVCYYYTFSRRRRTCVIRHKNATLCVKRHA